MVSPQRSASSKQGTLDWKSRYQDNLACPAGEHLRDGVAAVTERILLTDCRQSYVHMHRTQQQHDIQN
ncbi:hypothetical protein GGP41_002257 [Bipolaris sorokiniana]|uniref:Uncharacterized protein n=1 Tax=Cochliobolus sativus TaxID=45130 RepID=A0A8H5Z646_COCSA|nr:hypothetical protein GGP41_002257 [Bipolaris sorokiniana]